MPIKNIIFQHVTRAFLLNRLMSLLFILVAFTSSAVAQSAERSRPTLLMSEEIVGDAVATNSEYFYTFTAVPGELSVTVEVTSSDFSTAFSVDVFDARNNLLGNATTIATNGRTEVGSRRIRIARRQPVIMRLRFDGNAARYTVRLGGAAEFDGDAARRSRVRGAASAHTSGTMAPNSSRQRGQESRGTMRVEMEDGTMQEINLDRVRQITFRP